jgi:hypothetical protein
VHIFPYYAAIFATVVYFLLNAGPPWRVLGAVVLAAEILLQVGGSAYIVYTNPYLNDYLATVRFVQDHAKPGSYVVATIEFGFGFGFDHMRDDMSLGYYNHREPDVIIVDGRYREWFDIARRGRTARSEFIENLMRDQFHLEYHSVKYDVYLRNRQPLAFLAMKTAPATLRLRPLDY